MKTKSNIIINRKELDMIADLVCDYYNLNKETLFSKTRVYPVPDARHIFRYLSVELLESTLVNIANFESIYGKHCDHSTISVSHKKVSEERNINSAFKNSSIVLLAQARYSIEPSFYHIKCSILKSIDKCNSLDEIESVINDINVKKIAV